MPTVAEQLRSAREARGLSVHQVAEATKIRTEHIRALEEGNYDMFAAPVYIRGFARTCAALLKLDVPSLIADLDRELSATEKFAEHPSFAGREKGAVDFLTLQLSRVNPRVALGILIAVILLGATLGAFMVWRKGATSDPLKNVGEGVYQPTNRQSGETLPVPPPGQRR